ncbi:MAG TPA: acyl-CoA thioesterase, partial [Tenuifilaceae bacterium]|nr:acyl-CoA thioesterase [Tenuifilaceae bacterium]
MTIKPHSYFHSTPIQIRVNDIDPLNHVNNSVYQQYFDLGKIAYFNRVLGEHLNLETEGLVLANITIDYLKPITLYDSIEVFTRIYEMGTNKYFYIGRCKNLIWSLLIQSILNDSNVERICDQFG